MCWYRFYSIHIQPRVITKQVICDWYNIHIDTNRCQEHSTCRNQVSLINLWQANTRYKELGIGETYRPFKHSNNFNYFHYQIVGTIQVHIYSCGSTTHIFKDKLRFIFTSSGTIHSNSNLYSFIHTYRFISSLQAVGFLYTHNWFIKDYLHWLAYQLMFLLAGSLSFHLYLGHGYINIFLWFAHTNNLTPSIG